MFCAARWRRLRHHGASRRVAARRNAALLRTGIAGNRHRMRRRCSAQNNVAALFLPAVVAVLR